jgi:methyl-accepting chemotaxis protein
MKKVILAFTLQWIIFYVSGQKTMDQLSMRQLATQYCEEHAVSAKEVFLFSDSLTSVNSKLFLMKLDSISNDSLSGKVLSPLIELEKHFYFKNLGRTDLAMNALKRFQSSFEELQWQNPFYYESLTYAASEFDRATETPFALMAYRKLFNASIAKLDDQRVQFDIQRDSLDVAMMQLKNEVKTQKENAEHDRRVLLQALAAAGVMILIFLVLLLLSRWRSRKKIKALIAKQNDRSELDELSDKFTALSTEAQQFKHTAQLTINKLNAMDVSNRKAVNELGSFTEELQKSLEELRQQCETNKSTISPPVYMAIQNIATRLNSAAAIRIKAMHDLLK